MLTIGKKSKLDRLLEGRRSALAAVQANEEMLEQSRANLRRIEDKIAEEQARQARSVSPDDTSCHRRP
jgi:hypothetical protein